MSKLYASGTIADAHIFLFNGETSSQSILWNTEIHTLRQRQQTGEVNKIWVHTLKPEPLLEYQTLLENKKSAAPGSPLADEIDQKLTYFLKEKDNWIAHEIDDSNHFQLKTSGFTGAHRSISYGTLKEVTRNWIGQYKNIKMTKKADDYEKQLNKIQSSLLKGENPQDALSELEKLSKQISAENFPTNRKVNERFKTLQSKVSHAITETNLAIDRDSSDEHP